MAAKDATTGALGSDLVDRILAEMVTGPTGDKAREKHTIAADKGKKRKGEKSIKSSSAKSAKTHSTAKGTLTAEAVESVTPASQVLSSTVVVDPAVNTQVPNSQVPSPAYSQVSPNSLSNTTRATM